MKDTLKDQMIRLLFKVSQEEQLGMMIMVKQQYLQILIASLNIEIYGNQILTGTGTGTVTSAHVVTAVGGGSGTTSIGQFVTELSIDQELC